MKTQEIRGLRGFERKKAILSSFPQYLRLSALEEVVLAIHMQNSSRKGKRALIFVAFHGLIG